jgi:hypothetical protein
MRKDVRESSMAQACTRVSRPPSYCGWRELLALVIGAVVCVLVVVLVKRYGPTFPQLWLTGPMPPMP